MKKSNGLIDRQFGDQIDRDPQRPRAIGKHEPRQKIAVRILLPVLEMIGTARPPASS